MTIRFLAISDIENSDQTYNAWLVDAVLFEGSTLIDRVLEDVYFEIKQNNDDSFSFACADPEDAKFLKQQCINIKMLWERTQEMLTPGEQFILYKVGTKPSNLTETFQKINSRCNAVHVEEHVAGDYPYLDVEVWDDTTPLDETLRLVHPPVMS